MQFNQPYFATGFNNGAPFFPLNTSFAAQCVQSPEVIGEGEVVSLVLPDGNVQLFFLPTNKWCAPFITIPNKSSCWFVKSVANPVPHPTYFQNQFPSNLGQGMPPCPRLTLGYSGSFEVPTPFKFHSDGATSTTDIHYFFPRLTKLNNATKLCTGVQVAVSGQSSSCQSEAVSCIPSNCGQHNCSCCNRKCDNKGAFNSNREISSQGDTKNRYQEDLIICKCCTEPKVKRSSHSQTCMSIDEPSIEKKRKKEKKHHSQPKKKRSTHSQTSMSIDESKSEIRSSRSKKQKRDTRKTNECRKVKSRRRVSGKCSCTSIRKRKGQRKKHTRKNHTSKNHTTKDKKINRTSNTDFVRCICSDISLSSSKSVGTHFTREQYFDNSRSSKDSNSTSSEMECQFCESCISSLELKVNLQKKNKSSTEVTEGCYSSELSTSVSQTDTSHGMSIDEAIKGNRNNPLKSDVGKKNQENNKGIRGGKMIDQEMKYHENNKKIDKTSVTCVCLYPASGESLVKNTPPESNKPLHPLSKHIANYSSKLHNSLDKIARLSHKKSSNTGPIYKADADFCECFSNLIQPPTRDKTFKEIEKDLKRSEMAKSSKGKKKKEKILMVSCKCSKMLLVDIGTQASKVLEKNKKPMSIENKEEMDLRPKGDCNSSKAVQSRETGKQLCGTFGQVCCCVTPDFSNRSPVDSNNLFNFNKTTPLHYRASRILDTAKHTPYIPKSNSV